MYPQQKSIKSYGRIANTESDPIKQIVMLYDGAIKFLNLSAADIEAGDFEGKREHSNRAIDIVNYLQSILNFETEGTVAASLDNLYTIVTATVLKASVGLDADLMRRAAKLLSPVRDAWETIAAGTAGQAPFSSSATQNQAFALNG